MRWQNSVAVVKLLFVLQTLIWLTYPNNVEASKMRTNKILLIIAHQNFRDEEYFDTKKEIEAAGLTTQTASTSMDTAKGTLGGTTRPDLLLKNANIEDYDGIAFIGGAGSAIYWNDDIALELAKKTSSKGKVLAAICIAPVTLAKAGLLKGKKFNAWESEIENIKSMGGIHSAHPVVVDGKIVTGNGPKAAPYFGKKIAELAKQ